MNGLTVAIYNVIFWAIILPILIYGYESMKKSRGYTVDHLFIVAFTICKIHSGHVKL